jgi:hypothetical protein
MYRLKFKSQYGNMEIYIYKGITMMESGVQHALELVEFSPNVLTYYQTTSCPAPSGGIMCRGPPRRSPGNTEMVFSCYYSAENYSTDVLDSPLRKQYDKRNMG